MTERLDEFVDAARLGRCATEQGQGDAAALAMGGFAIGYFTGDLDTGAAFIERALALNPNIALAWLYRGMMRVFLGDPDIAIKHLATAMRLNPLDPYWISWVQFATATAHFCAGRDDEASASVESGLRDQPNFLAGIRLAAASHALAGRMDDAMRFSLRAREIRPGWRVSHLRKTWLFRRPEDLATYVEGLLRAGFPE